MIGLYEIRIYDAAGQPAAYAFRASSLSEATRAARQHLRGRYLGQSQAVVYGVAGYPERRYRLRETGTIMRVAP